MGRDRGSIRWSCPGPSSRLVTLLAETRGGKERKQNDPQPAPYLCYSALGNMCKLFESDVIWEVRERTLDSERHEVKSEPEHFLAART